MIYVFLAEGFEEVEALTPVDYMRRCELEVKTVSIGSKLVVTGAHGIAVSADIGINDVELEKMEMVVLPGGMPGTLNLERSAELRDIIDFCSQRTLPIAAICAAPSILGHMQLLCGKRATCYTGFEDQLIGAEVCDENVVLDGNIITARSAGVANEFAFAIVEYLLGPQRCEKLKSALSWKDR